MCWYVAAPLTFCPKPLHHDLEIPQGLILPGLHNLTAEAAPTGDLVHDLHVLIDLARLFPAWLDDMFTELTGPFLTVLLLSVVA